MKINQKRPDFGHFKNRYLGRVEDPEGESSKEVTWREKSCDRTQRESCHGYSKQKRFRHLGSIQWNYLCHVGTAVKLCKDFEALCEMLSEFSSGHICACYSKLGQFHLDGANLQMQTYLMHQKWPYFMAVVFQPNWVDSIGPWIAEWHNTQLWTSECYTLLGSMSSKSTCKDVTISYHRIKLSITYIFCFTATLEGLDHGAL